MQHLLNLLAAIALLVWGIQMVRTGILRVFGANLRQLISRGVSTRLTALLSGVGVTAIVQSSTATALIVSAFVGQGMISLTSALVIMLGADVGSSLMAVVFSLDLSWLSPLCIFTGVVLFVARQDTTAGRVGRILIGLGLMLLALRLITEATLVLTQSETVRTLLLAVTSDITLEIITGAVLAVISYSSLATVLLVSALAGSGGIPGDVALGLVLGGQPGQRHAGPADHAQIQCASAPGAAGQPAVQGGRRGGHGRADPTLADLHCPAGAQYRCPGGAVSPAVQPGGGAAVCAIYRALCRVVEKILPPEVAALSSTRPHHLDTSALATPSLAISCAAREALHQADIVETMLVGLKKVWEDNDATLAQELRTLDDRVDDLYSAIKYYLTKISRAELDQREGQRWTEVINFTINMEQVGDLVERILQEIEDKKIKKGRDFSSAGLEEINEMHAHLVANLHLAMSVFLNGNVRDAQRLLKEKARFRDLELAYAASHLNRLSDGKVKSIETSALHIDMISDLKRINSLLCSLAYPVLEAAGLIEPRLKDL